jgi:3-phenylpropionate/trans-cinnamate dioxygenase ferredoxin subunit
MMKHEICAEADLAVGQQIAVEAGGVKLLLFHLEDGFYATQSSCTHLFMPLKKGKIIDGCKVQCPFHRAHFDIRSGEVAKWADFPPGIQLINTMRKEKALQTYPVTVTDGKVLVDI